MVDKKTLYEQLGGEDAIEAVVDKFYDKVMADPLVNVFFKNTDMKKQRKHQKQFMMMAFGGPNQYAGQNMRKAHEGMGLKDEHFDAIVKHLAATLKEFNVSDDLIKAVADKLEPLRNDVLGR